jgi:hypothetical protein
MNELNAARQFIQDRIKGAGPYVAPSVRPLSVPDDHGDPLPAGSATLLWHRGRRYLVSAAHVLEAYEDRAYYLGTETGWVEIPGPFHITRPPGGRRDDDLLDFGFRQIEDSLAPTLGGCRFITADQVATGEKPTFEGIRRSKYLVLGYPHNRFEYAWGRRVTTPGNLAFAGATVPQDRYQALGVSPESHVLLELDPDQVGGPTGIQTAPRLVGMSGGAIFQFPSIQVYGVVALPRLVGITVEQRKQDKLFIGTRIDVVFQGIDAAA